MTDVERYIKEASLDASIELDEYLNKGSNSFKRTYELAQFLENSQNIQYADKQKFFPIQSYFGFRVAFNRKEKNRRSFSIEDINLELITLSQDLNSIPNQTPDKINDLKELLTVLSQVF